MMNWMIGRPIVSETDDGMLALAKGPYFLSHEEARKIIEALQVFYAKHTPEELREANDKARAEIDAELNPEPVGYVYLMQRNDAKIYKLGATKNISRRKYQLQRNYRVDLHVIHSFFAGERYFDAEDVLHKRYAESRIRDDWFNLTDKEVADFKTIQSLDDIGMGE